MASVISSRLVERRVLSSTRQAILVCLYVLSLATLALGLYLPVLGASPVADDLGLISQAMHQKSILFAWGQFQPGLFRPGVTAYIWIATRLFGFNWTGYHLAGVALLALGGIMVAAVANRLAIATGNIRHEKRMFLSALAGVLFVVWPTHTEAVNWICDAGDLLGVIFGLGAVYFLLLSKASRDPSGRMGLLAGGLIATSMALFCKESSIMLFAVASILCFVARRRDQSWISCSLEAASFVAVTAFYMLARHHVLGAWVGGYGGSLLAPNSGILTGVGYKLLDVWFPVARQVAPYTNTLALGQGAMAAFGIGLAFLFRQAISPALDEKVAVRVRQNALLVLATWVLVLWLQKLVLSFQAYVFEPWCLLTLVAGVVALGFVISARISKLAGACSSLGVASSVVLWVGLPGIFLDPKAFMLLGIVLIGYVIYRRNSLMSLIEKIPVTYQWLALLGCVYMIVTADGLPAGWFENNQKLIMLGGRAASLAITVFVFLLFALTGKKRTATSELRLAALAAAGSVVMMLAMATLPIIFDGSSNRFAYVPSAWSAIAIAVLLSLSVKRLAILAPTLLLSGLLLVNNQAWASAGEVTAGLLGQLHDNKPTGRIYLLDVPMSTGTVPTLFGGFDQLPFLSGNENAQAATATMISGYEVGDKVTMTKNSDTSYSLQLTAGVTRRVNGAGLRIGDAVRDADHLKDWFVYQQANDLVTVTLVGQKPGDQVYWFDGSSWHRAR